MSHAGTIAPSWATRGALVVVYASTVLLFAQGAGARTDRSASSRDPVVVAAGDIARCEGRNDERTAAIVRRNPRAAVLTLGDNVYPAGTKRAYRKCYGPSWGSFKYRTRPTPGNHDVKEDGSEGGLHYRRYFRMPDYYAFDVGRWRIYSLNSELPSLSEQAAWLDRDLRANQRACVLAYWHRPLFSSGRHGGIRDVKPLWDVLYAHRAEVVLNGNDHNYERFDPQSPDGRPTDQGIRQFVVGTGGARLRPIHLGKRAPTSAVASSTAFGVLRLVLRERSYAWRFVPVRGHSLVNAWGGGRINDRGTASCV